MPEIVEEIWQEIRQEILDTLETRQYGRQYNDGNTPTNNAKHNILWLVGGFWGGKIQDVVVRHLVEYAGKCSVGVAWLQMIPA